MRKWYRLSVLATCVLGGCVAGVQSPLRQATAATAQTVCNAAFVSRLDPARTLRAELHAEPGVALIDWALHYSIDDRDKSVSAHFLGGQRAQSIYREGRGCTLVFGTAPAPTALPAPPDRGAMLPEIAGAELVPPTDPRIIAAIDAAFVEPGKGPLRRTQAVVIVHRGRVIGERYAPGISVRTPLNSHSLAKSVVNALVGILVGQGRLQLNQLVSLPLPDKPTPAASRATVAGLLRMDAGFGFDEGLGASIASRIWYDEPDTAGASIDSIARSDPGVGWGYCNRCYSIVSKLIGDTVGGGPQGVRDFAERTLFGPTGMRDVILEFDQAGTLMGANAAFASARDFARFGLLYLNDGAAGGHRVLPQGWVAMSSSPTAGSGYGAGFWLNTTQQPMPVWPIDWGLPHAPADAYFARGHLGQYIVIVPSHDLVIVRMGQSHGRDAEKESVGRLTADVIDAIPADRSASEAAL